MFRSMKTTALYGFTVDPTGANLPKEDGPWDDVGALAPLGKTLAEMPPEIAQAIERSGYALLKAATVWGGADRADGAY
jgi:hypothetical protein